MSFDDRNVAAAYPAPPYSPAPPDPPVRLRFVGHRGDYWRLMVRGAALQAVTLGIYRFWLFTDMRRFLWAGTEIDGETFEYTGTAIELLLGFLMAIGILIPVYALLFVFSLQMGALSRFSGVVGFVALAAFGQYAAYRARRYRLTRTVWRGLRFHQTGSPVAYALRAMLWWVAVVATLGLAYPWMEASLERYKMRNTFYGDLGGQFVGTGFRLFMRGILLWVFVLLCGIVPLALLVIARPMIKDTWAAIGFQLVPAWIVVSALFTYPGFQAIVMRWWLDGLRLGGTAAASDLRMRRFYGAYLRYVLYVLLFTFVFAIAAGIVAWIGYAALSGTIDFAASSIARDGPVAAAGIAAYVIYVLGISTIYQVVVRFRLWQVAVESVVVSGLAALDDVRASAATSSALGEGLADALGGAGI